MLEVTDLTKHFGRFCALDGLCMTVPTGAVYGLIGYSNGAGKSTLLRHLTGAFRPERGKALLDGEPVYENPAAKARMAYIPDELFFLSRVVHGQHGAVLFRALRAFRLDALEPHGASLGTGHRQAPARLFQGNAEAGGVCSGRQSAPGRAGARRAGRRPRPGHASAALESHFAGRRGAKHDGGRLVAQPARAGGRLRPRRHSAQASCCSSATRQLQDTLVKVQVLLPENAALPPELPVLHASSSGRMRTLILQSSREAAAETLAPCKPEYFEAVPLSLEELFIYELGGADYEVKKSCFSGALLRRNLALLKPSGHWRRRSCRYTFCHSRQNGHFRSKLGIVPLPVPRPIPSRLVGMGIRAYYQPDSAVSVRNACGGLRFSLPAPGTQCLYAPRLPTHARDAFSHESAFRFPAGLCADLLRNRRLHAHTVALFLVRTFSSAPARLPCGAAAIHILYGLAVLCMQLSGRTVTSVLLYGLLNVLFALLRSAGGRYFQAHAARCCRLLRRFGTHLVSLPVVKLFLLNRQQATLYYPLALCAVGFCLLALSWLLYRRRRLECCGETVAYRFLRPIYAVLITIAGIALSAASASCFLQTATQNARDGRPAALLGRRSGRIFWAA